MSTNPVEHDTRLLELYRDLAKAEQTLGWKDSHYRSESLDRVTRQSYGRKDTRTIAEVAADMQVRRDEARVFWTERKDGDDAEHMVAYVVGKLDEVENSYREAVEAVRAIRRSIVEHEQGYTGWQRYFLVTSSAGLVHSGMNCPTCNKGRSATTFALVAAMSGFEASHLVEAVGPFLCSVCFPSAPVEWQEQDRVPVSVAQVLFDSGYDAFVAAWADFKTKRAARAAKKAAAAAGKGS